jgi:hypothetical protein
MPYRSANLSVTEIGLTESHPITEYSFIVADTILYDLPSLGLLSPYLLTDCTLFAINIPDLSLIQFNNNLSLNLEFPFSFSLFGVFMVFFLQLIVVQAFRLLGQSFLPVFKEQTVDWKLFRVQDTEE